MYLQLTAFVKKLWGNNNPPTAERTPSPLDNVPPLPEVTEEEVNHIINLMEELMPPNVITPEHFTD